MFNASRFSASRFRASRFRALRFMLRVSCCAFQGFAFQCCALQCFAFQCFAFQGCSMLCVQGSTHYVFHFSLFTIHYSLFTIRYSLFFLNPLITNTCITFKAMRVNMLLRKRGGRNLKIISLAISSIERILWFLSLE